MRVGYCVPVMPQLASYRLRVAIPANHLGCSYSIGTTGNPSFFFKNGNVRLAESLSCGIVYDVVNDHFHGKWAADYHGMCSIADKITVASERMAEIVKDNTGRDSTVIDDPYETEEAEAACRGNGVFWFGHSANLASLIPFLHDLDALKVCTNAKTADMEWSRESELRGLDECSVVFLTSNNMGASANRVVKALRAGRFVVTPAGCPDSWRELEDFIWIGDVAKGIEWAFNNREEACYKIQAGQKVIAERFNPIVIGAKWTELFVSI